jgi:2-polyprenyl-3-methyl-5-hydroxy-6-metoxy-1,4-benzoquinol methylase
MALTEQGNIEASVAYFVRFAFDRSVRVLDVGTRFGSFLYRLGQLGYSDTAGADVDAEALATGRKSYPGLAERLLHFDGTRLPFDGEEFDVVTAFDVIEHIPDVPAFLQEIKRVLRPNGFFLFQTPNIFTNVPKEVIYTRSLTRWRTFHCSLQTLGSLRQRLDEAGFREVKIEKQPICTDFNLSQVRQHLGPIGPVILRGLQRLPLALYPNFWGHARR